MLQSLTLIDGLVVVLLLVFIVGMSFYSSSKEKNTEDYFMAGRSLKWWSVAGSIFGTNIHAQQIIGMMGIGYSVGFAQSHYEVWAIPAILVVAYIFVPIYRKRNFFTLSQFLESRYNSKARLVYTILMIVFIMIQLIGGFYIGSRTLGLLTAGTWFQLSYLQGIMVIALVTVTFTVVGGMESVVIADNILTVIMIISVILIGSLTYMQPEINGLWNLIAMDHAQANKMHLYLPSNHPDLPWSGIFSGLTILNMFYWSTNQYQVQRVLAAQTDRDARLGSIVAGFLKLIIPFFSIAAGTAAFYLFRSRFGADNNVKPDDVFLTLLKTVVPVGYGFVGLILAGLTCAIFSAIYSMMNSVSTMMAFDVYKKYIKPEANERETIRYGQVLVVLLCVTAMFLAYYTYSPSSKDNFFLILAKQTSYIKPGLVVVFFWGIFWRKTNANAAVVVLCLSPFIGLMCDVIYKSLAANIPIISDTFGQNFNFLYRVFCIFTIGSILIYILSLILNKNEPKIEKTNADLSIQFKGIPLIVKYIAIIQVVFLVLVFTKILTPQMASFPVSMLTFLSFIPLLKKADNEDYAFYENDIFYAGLLASAMVWIMYYFA
jgi:solute:Na+ symporter, SSS family